MGCGSSKKESIVVLEDKKTGITKGNTTDNFFLTVHNGEMNTIEKFDSNLRTESTKQNTGTIAKITVKNRNFKVYDPRVKATDNNYTLNTIESEASQIPTMRKIHEQKSSILGINKTALGHSYEKVKTSKRQSILKLKGSLKGMFKNIIVGCDLKEKSKSLNTLDNKVLNCINYSVKRLEKYYKNQLPPTNPDQPFIDPKFPPNNDSIFCMKNGKYIDTIESRRAKYLKDFTLSKDEIIWLKAEEIFQSGIYSIFTNDVGVDDVQQGNVGNCYFMASLTALTEYPQLLYQLFKNFIIPKNGCYEIGLNVEGKWQIIIVDDYFPCSKKTRMPLFAKPNGNELWVMLLEKAWAKINGGYLNISGGWATEVLRCLTSFPIQYFNHNKISGDELWYNLCMAEQNGHIVACCSKFKEEIESFGLIPGHSFTLISVKEGIIKGKNIRLVKLRNPWGYKEWNGPWSDQSQEWTKEAREVFLKDVGLVQKDDGLFWMSYEDFLKFFIVSELCKISYPQCVKHFTIPKETVNEPHVFELQIFKKCKINITAIKKNYRFHRTMQSDCELVINMILVKKNLLGIIEFVCSTNEVESNPMIEAELHHGYYLLYVHANYKHTTFDKLRKYNIYISSNQFFDMFAKGVDSNFNLLAEIVEHQVYQSINDSSNEYTQLINARFENTTYGYMYIKNNKESAYEFNGKDDTENFEIIYPNTIKTKTLKRMIPKKSSFLIIGIRREHYERYSFKWDYKSILIDSNDNNNAKIEEERNIEPFIKNYPDIPHDEDGYDFYYKVMEIDQNNIIEKIDEIEVTKNYFLSKYPDEVGKILDIEELNDGEEVIFKDVYDFGESIYLGEWKTKEDFVRHGRGWFIWSDGSSYMGQIQNNLFEGYGIFTFLNGDKCQISFKDGKMDGIGKYVSKDGQEHLVEYRAGLLIS
jgi:hypothetical protein